MKLLTKDRLPLKISCVARHSIATVVVPPSSACLHAPGPFGEPWRFYHPGQNFFVEHSTFFHGLAAVDSYAFVNWNRPGDTQCQARFLGVWGSRGSLGQ